MDFHNNRSDFDYDCVCTTNSSRYIRWAGTNYSSLGSFASATGNERNGMQAAPGCVDAAKANYLLRSNSPLIDKEVNIPGVSNGYAGNAPDIDAFEYGKTLVIP